MKRLPVLCAQSYHGCGDMRVEPCERCPVYWRRGKCTAETGAEGLPAAIDIPPCPISDRCQHQIQASPNPCTVRSKGLVCESALIFSGMTLREASDHPASYNFDVFNFDEEA